MPFGASGSVRRHFLAALLALGLGSASVWAQDASQDADASGGELQVAAIQELTPELRESVEQGVAWLARQQGDRSGAWACTPPSYRMSITALCGLALLAHGDTPDSGKYARNVRKAVEWVLTSQWKEGEWAGLFFDRPQMEDKDRPMHGHGFALLFLAEAYGNTRDERLRRRMHEAIALACRLTERTISRDGGWYYHPGAMRDEGSVTITQIQGLRSAHNAGIWIDPGVIERAVDYVKASQMEDGGIRYTLRWGRTSPALTAAGVSVFHGAGQYGTDHCEKGYAYLRQNLETDPSKNQFYFYTHLYAAQAMFQRGGPEWASYFPRVRRELISMRRGYPYWDSPYGPAYGTSISLLILQIPMRYLPIFQR